jgi:two-component system CheB/CheR fusion protein
MPDRAPSSSTPAAGGGAAAAGDDAALARAYEDLEATTEALRSTTAELEAQMETASEELAAINQELDRRTADVERLNAYVASVLDAVPAAVVVVDVDQRVRAWNRRAVEMWGVARDDALGRPLAKVEVGLPAEALALPVRAVLAGQEDPEDRVLDQGEGAGQVRLGYGPLLGAAGEVEGVVLTVGDA